MRAAWLAVALTTVATTAPVVYPSAAPATAFSGAGPYRLSEDWLVTCDNVASCVAVSAGVEAHATMRISRSGGWRAPLELQVDIPSGEYEGSALQLALFPASQRPHATPGRRARTRLELHRLATGRFALAEEDLPAFFAMAREASAAQLLASDGQMIASISLRGLVAALDRIDHVQGRTGTITGTYTRGDVQVPLAAIMPPPAPQLDPQGGEPDPDAATGNRAFLIICGIGLPRRAGDAVAWRMAGGKRIIAVDCDVTGLNTGPVWLLQDQSRALDLARLPQPDLPLAGELYGMLPNSWFDHRAGVLHALELGREEGDCGSRLSWQWTGQGFQLLEAYRMPLCVHLEQEGWPRTWTAELSR